MDATPEKKMPEAATEARKPQEDAAAAKKALGKGLLDAARKGDLQGLKSLLAKGADLMANDDGNTALFYAAQGGHMDAVLFCLQAGIPVDVKNRIGSTPLMGAAGGGHTDIALLLRDLGSDPAYRNMCGISAYGYARSAHRDETVAALSAPRDVDEVTLTRPVEGFTLRETFNFARRDRLSVLRDAEGRLQSVRRDGFDALADKASLREAFGAYAQKGGKLPETEFFPAPPAAPEPPPAPPAPKRRWWAPWKKG